MSTPHETSELTYIRSVNRALHDSLAEDERVILFGEDVALPNGPFGASKGLHGTFGARVFDTPISESAMVGAALGSAMGGLRPIVEIMYADFLFVAMDQIVNQVANTRYVSRGRLSAPLVIRTQQGSTPGSCAQHSQSVEAMFAHVPGLRVATPATSQDAYGILRDAVAADDPVLVIESRRLYPTKGPVVTGLGHGRMGRADVVRSGDDVTVVTWGTSRAWALAAADVAAESGVSCEVIDLRWIAPWDRETVLASAARTRRLLVVHEAHRTGGFGAEVAATAAEELGSGLEAVARVGSRMTPIPSSPVLSERVLPGVAEIVAEIHSLAKEFVA